MRFVAASSLILLVASIAVFFPPNPVLASVVSVSSGSFYFEDASVGDGKIVVNVGDQLRVTVVDGGKGTPHTVEIAELGVSSGKLGRSSTYVTPVLSTPGTYTLFCKPHRNKGHWTTLVVLGDTVETTTTTTTTTAPETVGTSTTLGGGLMTSTTVNPAVGSTTTSPPEGSPSPSTWATASPSIDRASDSPEAVGGEPLPSGVTQPSDLVWTRSARLGLYASLPLLLIAVIAVRGASSSTRRRRI